MSVLLATGAAWVSYTRVRDNRHYPGDVVAGSILGASTALFFSWSTDQIKTWRGASRSAPPRRKKPESFGSASTRSPVLNIWPIPCNPICNTRARERFKPIKSLGNSASLLTIPLLS
ncbi:MAG: phosphatase PAP2 family protein [Candidatus Hinthialibacter sp.]